MSSNELSSSIWGVGVDHVHKILYGKQEWYRSTLDTLDELWQATSIRGMGIRGIELYGCKTDTWHIHSQILSSCDLRSACRTPQVCQFLCTSESTGQILPSTIRGVKYLGHRIARSDVWQKAAQTGPNPRYWGIWPKSDIFDVRAIEFWL